MSRQCGIVDENTRFISDFTPLNIYERSFDKLQSHMVRIVPFKDYEVTLHVIAWCLVLFLPYLVSSSELRIGPLPRLYFPLSGIIHIIIFYFNIFFLYPKFLNKTYWWLYIVSVVLLIIFSFRVKAYMLASWFPDALPDARSHLLFPSVLVFILSIFYSITAEKMRAEKIQKQNKAIQLEIELKFLRSQISPHFLFNILTNLASLARKKSDQLETSLVMLSGLMRYMLYSADKKISLQKEVEYLECYVSLQKLRFGHDVKIVFNFELPQEEYNIEPMLLIPFVENAFKHGTGVDQPFIVINLKCEQGVLTFEVKNKFEPGIDPSKDDSSGIGLNNVQSRLNLLYPNSHEMVVQVEKNIFNIKLTLNLW